MWAAVALLVSVTGVTPLQAQAASRGTSPALLAPRSPALTALDAAPSAAGAFGVLRSSRVLDTRYGIGAAKAPLPAGATLRAEDSRVGRERRTGGSPDQEKVTPLFQTKPC